MAERLRMAGPDDGGISRRYGYRETPDGYRVWDDVLQQPEYEAGAELLMRERRRGNTTIKVYNKELATRLAAEARADDIEWSKQYAPWEGIATGAEQAKPATKVSEGQKAAEQLAEELTGQSATEKPVERPAEGVAEQRLAGGERLEMLRTAVDRNGQPYYRQSTLQRIAASQQEGQPATDPRAEEVKAALEKARAEETKAKEKELAEILGNQTSEQYIAATQGFIDMLKAEAEKYQREIDRAEQRNLTKEQPAIYKNPQAASYWSKRLEEVTKEIDHSTEQIDRVTTLLGELHPEAERKAEQVVIIFLPGLMAAGGNADLNAPAQLPMRTKEDNEDRIESGAEASGGELALKATDKIAISELPPKQTGEAAAAAGDPEGSSEESSAETNGLWIDDTYIPPERVREMRAYWMERQRKQAEAAQVETEAPKNPEQREQKVQGIWSKIRKSAGFRKVVRAAKSLVLGTALLATVASTAAGIVTPVHAVGADGLADRPAIVQMYKMQRTGEQTTGRIGSTIPGYTETAEKLEVSDFEGLGEDTRRVEEFGVRTDYSQDYLRFDEKGGKSNFGVSKAEYYEDRDGTVEALLDICRNQPETLAATVSAFPSVLQACGLDLKPGASGHIDPREIDLMFNQEGGGDLQERLLKNLQTMLENQDATTLKFYREYTRAGFSEGSWYMYTMGSDQETVTAASTQLNLDDQVFRNGEYQVRITFSYVDKDGKTQTETGDFNMDCGFQLNYEHYWKVTTAKTETPTPAQTQTSEELPPVDEGHPPIVVVDLETPIENGAPSEETPEEKETPKDNEALDPKPTPSNPDPGKPRPSDPGPSDPGPSDPGSTTPDPKPTPEPEVVPPKNEEAELKNAVHEGQENLVTKTDENEAGFAGMETEEQVTIKQEDADRIQEEQVPDSTQSPEEQAAAEAAEAAAKAEADRIEAERANQSETERREQENNIIDSILAGLNTGGARSSEASEAQSGNSGNYQAVQEAYSEPSGGEAAAPQEAAGEQGAPGGGEATGI